MRLRATRVTAQRGDVTLFSQLDADIQSGEALIVSGRNGSGKTTLLRMLAGLTAPADGEIRWNGEIVHPFAEPLRDAVVFIGHWPALKDELTPEENLAHWMALDGVAVPRERIFASLDAVALAAQRRLPVRVLSQGQRRRIGLARLQLSTRPLWILDEPLTALDAGGTDILDQLLDTHLAGGGLCVAASHSAMPIAAARQRSLALGAEAAR
jgi:heme exporter protein A